MLIERKSIKSMLNYIERVSKSDVMLITVPLNSLLFYNNVLKTDIFLSN